MTQFFDGHNDVLSFVHPGRTGRHWSSFLQPAGEGAVTLAKAATSGYKAGFFAAYCEARPDGAQPVVDRVDGLATTVEMISDLLRIEGASDGRLAIVRTIAELDQAIERGALAAVMHLEGAEPIDEDLITLEVLHAFGLRSLGLTWSRENAFAFGGTPAAQDAPGERSNHAPGLKAAGKRLVRRCNDLGIVVDMAHLNEAGFWDVAEISDRPLVVSHANAYTLSPVTRNVTDAQLDAIGSSNGVIGVCFYPPMLRADAHNRPDTPLSAVADHLDYIRDRIGIEHVAIGSDFGTAPMPDALTDATDLHKLWTLLAERGWSDSDIHLVAWSNWVRVLGDTWS